MEDVSLSHPVLAVLKDAQDIQGGVFAEKAVSFFAFPVKNAEIFFA